MPVRLDGQERHELAAQNKGVEDLHRLTQAAVIRAAERLELRIAQLLVELRGDLAAVVQRGVVVDPLPELGTGDLGGGGVLHQVADGDRALTLEQGIEVLEGNRDVRAHPVLGDAPLRDPEVEQRNEVPCDSLADGKERHEVGPLGAKRLITAPALLIPGSSCPHQYREVCSLESRRRVEARRMVH